MHVVDNNTGPNHFESCQVKETMAQSSEGADRTGDLAVMAGAVLHIQGDELASQPMHDETGGCLLWNGEVFGGLEEGLCGRSGIGGEQDGDEACLARRQSDTYVVSAMLSQALAGVGSRDSTDAESCCQELATKAATCLAAIEGSLMI